MAGIHHIGGITNLVLLAGAAVVGKNLDGTNPGLFADNMFDSGEVFQRQPTMRHDHDPDHAVAPMPCPPMLPRGGAQFPDVV